MIPSPEAVDRRLAEILVRGDVNLGAAADTERLMLMLTRSCELRCGYCFVQKTETGVEMSPAVARRAIDLLMSSRRSRLELQLFGGEPTRRWDVLEEVLRYAFGHPGLGRRRLTLVLTTNGVGLDAERVRRLQEWPVVVLFSLDGDAEAHRRFRGAHLLDDASVHARILAALDLLLASRLDWFMNCVLAPAASGEVGARYAWALARGVPRLQLNYAVGMRWSEGQTCRYLEGLEAVLRRHHADPGGVVLFNWRSDCEPVMLSDDLIVDVDGSVVHDGAVFLERAFGRLKETYARGHVDTLRDFDPLRWSLSRLYDTMVGTYPEGSLEREIIVHNIRLGAAVDLLVQDLSRELKSTAPSARSPSR